MPGASEDVTRHESSGVRLALLPRGFYVIALARARLQDHEHLSLADAHPVGFSVYSGESGALGRFRVWLCRLLLAYTTCLFALSTVSPGLSGPDMMHEQENGVPSFL